MIEKLLYGVAYYYEYLPEDRMEEDFRMMNEAGINNIRIAESTWSTWEPKDGVFDFSCLHKVIKTAQKYNLSVIIGTPTYAVPSWLSEKLPDLLCVTHRGTNLYGARQNFDITHPGYLFHAERIIRRLMNEVKDYPNVIGYQLDNETKAYDSCSPRIQKMFRTWLKDKFKTIENLNREFGFSYWSNSVSDWEDLPDVRGTINASYGAEFEAFQRETVTRFLCWQRSIIDDYRRPDQFVTHNFDFEWRNYSFGLQPDVNHFDAADAVTIAGCDIYHPSESALTGAEITFCGSLNRGLKNDNYLILETEAQGNFGWLPYPQQLRLQAFSHVASGAVGVNYWHWHSIHNSFETYWKGLLSHDFSKGAVYREACTIGKDFARISDRIMHMQKKNKAAIVVSNRSLNGFKWFPAASLGEKPAHTYNDYVRWIADSLHRLNVEYDILNDTARDFSDYDLVCLPALYSAPEELISAVKSYVSDGGHVISGFRSFFSNEHLRVYHDAQPHALTDCFGFTYDRFTKPVDVTIASAIPGWPENTAACDWMEMIENSDAEVLCSYVHPAWGGIPAVTRKTYQKGQAVYLGCYFSPAALDALMKQLLNDWGMELSAYQFPICIKKGCTPSGKTLTWYLNYSLDTQEIKVSAGTELLSETEYKDGDTLTLPAWGAAVVES